MLYANISNFIVRYVTREMMIARGADPDVPKPLINLLFILPTMLGTVYLGANVPRYAYIYMKNCNQVILMHHHHQQQQ